MNQLPFLLERLRKYHQRPLRDQNPWEFEEIVDAIDLAGDPHGPRQGRTSLDLLDLNIPLHLLEWDNPVPTQEGATLGQSPSDVGDLRLSSSSVGAMPVALRTVEPNNLASNVPASDRGLMTSQGRQTTKRSRSDMAAMLSAHLKFQELQQEKVADSVAGYYAAKSYFWRQHSEMITTRLYQDRVFRLSELRAEQFHILLESQRKEINEKIGRAMELVTSGACKPGDEAHTAAVSFMTWYFSSNYIQDLWDTCRRIIDHLLPDSSLHPPSSWNLREDEDEPDADEGNADTNEV